SLVDLDYIIYNKYINNMSDKKRTHDDIVFDDDEEDNNSTGNDGEDNVDDNDDEDIEQDQNEMIEDEEEEEDDDEKDQKFNVWRPGVDTIQEGEELTYDSSAYDMMHTMTVEWPCLSFHPLRDTLGLQRNKYPHTMYMVSGTQADQAKNNKVLVMKVSSLYKTKHDEADSDDEMSDDEDDDDIDEENDGEALLQTNYINHNGCVNRIRAMEQQSNIIATWSDSRQVFLWNIHNNLKELDGENKPIKNQSPLHVITSHSDEGYSLDWSPTVVGRLASGDCKNMIYVTNASGATWQTDSTPFKGHQASVEDLQWSPSEENVFVSCSSDQTIKVWDIRAKKPAISVHAHESDVNVVSWSRKVAYLLVSGGDDGTFKVWDLRNFKNDSPVSNFNYHTGPITSVEWNPFDESQVIVSSSDNQVTIWDFSLEEDTEEFEGVEKTNGTDDDYQVPPQLFFVHQGQHEVKEVHWHPQIPHVAITTAYEGFNIFKSFNSE
ncbi:hypothetical protein SAMD00019534_083130, partial [Acytostelium subglobosum LB1]|uniref:hypothetical protein n=1 Tax=Acytostelium subglobosum LB1 TaxID=1410327 RepID=UPI00064502B2